MAENELSNRLWKLVSAPSLTRKPGSPRVGCHLVVSNENNRELGASWVDTQSMQSVQSRYSIVTLCPSIKAGVQPARNGLCSISTIITQELIILFQLRR